MEYNELKRIFLELKRTTPKEDLAAHYCTLLARCLNKGGQQ